MLQSQLSRQILGSKIIDVTNSMIIYLHLHLQIISLSHYFVKIEVTSSTRSPNTKWQTDNGSDCNLQILASRTIIAPFQQPYYHLPSLHVRAKRE